MTFGNLMEVHKLFCEVENQINYTIISGIDGLFTPLPRAVAKQYIGIGEYLGLFILDVGGYYLITNKIGDDIKFTSNITQYGGAGTFELTKFRPTTISTPTGETTNTLYQSGNRFISLGFESDVSTVDEYKMRLLTAGLRPNDIPHDIFRYDIAGNILTTRTNFDLGVDNHGTQFNYINTLSLVKYMSTVETSNSVLIDQAKTAFNAKNYYYKTEDAGTWSGWYRSKVDGVAGEYLPFGGETGTKTIGYARYTDLDGYSYDKFSDITENEGIWSVIFPDNNLEYTSNTEPLESSYVFSNEAADPSQITLTFDRYVSGLRAVDHFTTGSLLK